MRTHYVTVVKSLGGGPRTKMKCLDDLKVQTPQTIAWAAGLFEGEGSVGLAKKKNARLQIQMTDEDVLRRFHAIVGVGKVYGPYQRKPEWKPYWAWHACGPDARTAMELFLPLSGERRTAKWTEVAATAT